jgi:hypothetical protein
MTTASSILIEAAAIGAAAFIALQIISRIIQ